MSAYHEAAIAEARQAWREAFWDSVAALRFRRQQRLADILWRESDCAYAYSRIQNQCYDITSEPEFFPDVASLLKRRAIGYEAACEKLLAVDFRP